MMEETKETDLREQYRKDAEFRGYVDRVSAAYRKPVEEVLQYALTRETAEYYRKEAAGKVSAKKSGYMPMGECI